MTTRAIATIAYKTPFERAETTKKYVNASKSKETRRAYAHSFNEFNQYCLDRRLCALPASPETVIAYITDLADRGDAVSTIQVKLSAIGFIHENAETENQEKVNPAKHIRVRVTMAGIKRVKGSAPKQKAPLLLDHIRQILAKIPDDLRGKRDKAILLVGFAGAFRRSELVDIRVEDVRWNSDGMTITLRRSKTDQDGEGLYTTIPTLTDKALCPVTALRAWLSAAEIKSGLLFLPIDRWGHVGGVKLDGREVARVVKRRAEAAGLDSMQLSGHSLRAGFVTAGVNAGSTFLELSETTHHKSEAMIKKYARMGGAGSKRAVRAIFGE